MKTIAIQKNKNQILLQSLNKKEKSGLKGQFSRQIQNTDLNQDKINGLNCPITSKEIEAIIHNLPMKNSPGLDNNFTEFFQTFKENPTPINSELFHNIGTGWNNNKFNL